MHDYNIPSPSSPLSDTPTTYITPTIHIILDTTYTAYLDTSSLHTITDIHELITSFHKLWLQHHNFPTTNMSDKLPLAYPSLKVHKNYLFRPIAASNACTLDILSKTLTIGFRCLSHSLQSLWDLPFLANNLPTQKMWLINDIHEIPARIKSLPHTIPHNTLKLETYDFSELYTSIPLNLLKQRLDKLIFSIWQLHTNRHTPSFLHINTHTKAATWTSQHPNPNHTSNHKFILSYQSFTHYLNFLIDNSYIHAAGHILKQVIGIPMGISPAVYIANFFLFSYELEFITHIIKHNPNLLKHFEHTSRFLDDCISINNPHFNDLKQQSNLFPHNIYPSQSQGLILKREYSNYPAITPCNFLNSRICLDTKTRTPFLYTTLYTKSRDTKYQNIPFINYPDYNSGLAKSCTKNLFTTLLHTINLVCQRKHDFIAETAYIFYKLKLAHYPHKVLKQKLYNYLHSDSATLYTDILSKHIRKATITSIVSKIETRARSKNFTHLLKPYT